MNQYIVRKVLSNNIVQCQKIGGEEDCIVQGKGVGFQKKRGDYIEEQAIEKVYFKHDTKNMIQYTELAEKSNQVLIDAVEEILSLMEERFGNEYDDYVHIALLDHLNFSIYRYHNNIQINNIFLEEYKLMYAEEYAFAKEMVAYINQCMQVTLPESEIGFITLHFHSALHAESVSKSALYMQIIASCIELIEGALHVHLNACSVERTRLVTHLKFALERADRHIEVANPVMDSLRSRYPKIFQISKDLATMLDSTYGIQLPEGELGYLILHIQNILMTSE